MLIGKLKPGIPKAKLEGTGNGRTATMVNGEFRLSSVDMPLNFEASIITGSIANENELLFPL